MNETAPVGGPPSPGRARGALARRSTLGGATAVLLLPVVTVSLYPLRGTISLGSVLLLYLFAVVLVAVAGGPVPAVCAAVVAVLAANFFYTEPLHTLWVDGSDSLIALGVFVVVAAVVAVTVDRAARRREDAVRAETRERVLADLVQVPVHETSVETVLEGIGRLLGWDTVQLEHVGQGGEARVLARYGTVPVPRGVRGDVAGAADVVPAGNGYRIVGRGPATTGRDLSLARRSAAAAARVWQNQELAAQARRARELSEQERVRTALLAAVGHDLRTPLAGMKAAVSSLRQTDVQLAEPDRQELLALVEDECDRLQVVLGNLLDMSRIEAGAVHVDLQPVLLEEVVARALLATARQERVEVDVDASVPAVSADAGLLERVVANLVDNAVRHAPPGTVVRVHARCRVRTVCLYVVDHGPGLADLDPVTVFEAFSHAGDAQGRSGAGVGLGLAIVKGFTEAMGGTVEPSRTPGGGLTMCIELERAG